MKDQGFLARIRKLTSASEPQPSPLHFPLRVERLSGKLSVWIYVHNIENLRPPIECWSMVSEGLQAVGQKELVLTIQRQPGQALADYPKTLLDFFAIVYDQARQGRVVDAGDFTELGSEIVPGFNGCAYVRPQELSGVKLPTPVLAVLLLKADELHKAIAFGVTRLLARLGDQVRYYPFPPWCDLTRATVSAPAGEDQTILAKVQRVAVRGKMCYNMQSGRTVLCMLTGEQATVEKTLSVGKPDFPLALLLDSDPSADACFVWRPGQQALSGIKRGGPEPAVFTGNFILFTQKRPDDSTQIIEDGVVLWLRDATWQGIREALQTGTTLHLRSGQGPFEFALEWIQQDYVSPTGVIYHCDDGWSSYEPLADAERDTAKQPDCAAHLQEVVFLTEDRVMAARVELRALVDYTQAIKDAVQAHFATMEPSKGQDLLIELELTPDGGEIRMATKPGIDDTVMQPLRDSVLAMRRPQVHHGPIRFQMCFQIWGDAPSST